METKLCRMNSSDNSTTINDKSSDDQSIYSTNVQSQTIKLNTPDLLDNPPIISQNSTFLTSPSSTPQSPNHLLQTSLPSNSNEQDNKVNGELNTEKEFSDQFSNSSDTLLISKNLTSSLSTNNNLNNNNNLDSTLDNKINLNTHSLSSSPPSVKISSSSSSSNNQINTELDNELNDETIKLSPSSKSTNLDLNKLSIDLSNRINDEIYKNEMNLNDQLTEKLKEQLSQQLNQQLTQQLTQQFNQQQSNEQIDSSDEQSENGEENCSEEEEDDEDCSSEDEKVVLNKKRSKSIMPHSCCKKKRKQSNPLKCDFELDKTSFINNQRQLNQLKQLTDLSNENNIHCELLKKFENLKNQYYEMKSDEQNNQDINDIKQQQHQLQQKQHQNENDQDEDEEEEGLVRKFPNTLSSVANATTRFFLSSHQTSNFVDKDADVKLNYTYYLAAAAAVATQSSLKNTKHTLNYCKECCSPFLSAEHEKMYHELNKTPKQQKENNADKIAFTQQLHNMVQKSKAMQDVENVFDNNFEMGQLQQQNAIDAMQLIKQLESGQLDIGEAKYYQQQLASLLNSNLLNTNNQMINPLSALLANRIFNPDSYCQICEKQFCNKYFLKTHKANKHSMPMQDQQALNEQKCISPQLGEYAGVINSTDQLNKYLSKGSLKQKSTNDSNNYSIRKSSPKREHYNEILNAIKSAEQHQQLNEDNNQTNNDEKYSNDSQQQKQRPLQQILGNANQLQQSISAVMQAESFANILRNSINPQHLNSRQELSTADLAQLLNSTNTNFLFTPERLREMGVMNPEAFCDICCKEFCNKYFLKTHKANKHGIHMEDDCDSSSCDSQSDQQDKQNKINNTDISNSEELEPGQCPSTLNPMDLSALLMINSFKQRQQQQQKQQSNFLQQNNPQLNQQLNSNQQSLKQTAEKDKSIESKSKLFSCEFCSENFTSNQNLKVHLLYSHKIQFKKDDDLKQSSRELSLDKLEQNTDRNNNSNENILDMQKDQQTNNTSGLDLTQQSIEQQQHNEDLLKFQQVIKELQQNSKNDLETEILKKFAILHKQQELAAKLNEEQSIYCDCCEKEFKNRLAFRQHNCPANENLRLADSPNSMFSNLSAQMPNTMLNNSNNSTLNYALNGDAESLVNQTGANNLNMSSNGRDSLNNPLLNNSNQQNRLSPNNNSILAGLQGLPNNLPNDITNSIFFSSTAGITLDPNNKQPKFVAGRNYCSLCNKELCNKYFMKTHMLKMHNINIDENPIQAASNSIVGGVMCTVCNKELCSKYFLKVHKQNTHGIYEEGGIPVTNSNQGSCASGQSGNVTNPLSQSNLSPNSCLTSQNGMLNQSQLLNAYESGLSKEQQQQLHQIQMQIKQNQQFLNSKNGNTSTNYPQQSSTPVSFNNNSNQQTPSPSNEQSVERLEKELFNLRGIDPSDTTNRYYNQYTEICPYCKRRFKSNKWLKNHIASQHQNLFNMANNTESNASKIKCIFCPILFSDQESHHNHLVNDHRKNLEEMILRKNNLDFANLGIDDPLMGERKMNSKKIEDQLLALQQQSTSSELNKNQSQKELSSKNELEIKDQLSDDEEDDKNFEKKQQQHSNLSNILQLMQKEQNNLQQQHDLSSEEEQFEEEDEELLSDEDKFAAMLSNNAQLQQLLLSNTASSNAQPSTSKVLNLYEELIGQQSFNQQDDQQELSDYERFTKLAAQQQLLQLEQEDKLKQLQNSSLRKLNNSIYTKLYQCNICEYNTRWLSNLYAHEKRRHNTCTSSQGNLKVITIRRDATSPNSRLNNNQMNLNNLLIGLENHQQQQQQQQQQKSTSSSSNNQTPTNRMNDDILNQLNDFNNNSNLSNNFANLLQTNDSSSTKTAIKPIKERTASGDGQFVCTICSKSYRHKHSLQRHLISHRNQENNTNNTSSNQQSNKLNQDQTTTHSAFKTELELPNESNNNTLNILTQSTNGTSTPSSFLNNRSSSVDSVKSGDHNLKHQQQMFSQEILESLISGSNSSILNNLMSGNVHSPPANSTPYSNSPTTADTTAMFTV